MNPKYKKHLILASLATLLPLPIGVLILLRSPSDVVSQLKPIAFMPIAMLVTLLAASWFTMKDPGNKNRNGKPLLIVLWIVPVMSNLCCGITYALFQGYEFSPSAFMMVPMGLMFAAIGNYLPKVKMNATMGIKVYWTYTSEENWAATHRFAGKAWFLGGLVLAVMGLLPEKAMVLMVPLFILLIILPIFYSWRYYKMQKARGDVLQDPNQYFKTNYRINRKVSAIFVIAILVFCALILFSGNLDYQFQENALFIQADHYSDAYISYDSIDSIQLRIGNEGGTRVGGFGSFRLLMGYFTNEEFAATSATPTMIPAAPSSCGRRAARSTSSAERTWWKPKSFTT